MGEGGPKSLKIRLCRFHSSAVGSADSRRVSSDLTPNSNRNYLRPLMTSTTTCQRKTSSSLLRVASGCRREIQILGVVYGLRTMARKLTYVFRLNLQSEDTRSLLTTTSCLIYVDIPLTTGNYEFSSRRCFRRSQFASTQTSNGSSIFTNGLIICSLTRTQS